MATAMQVLVAATKPRRGRRSRFSAEERKRLVDRAVLRLAEGVSLRQSAKEIGVSYETFRRWRMQESGSSRLRPVKAKPSVSERRSEATRELRLVTAAGHRVEGLELRQLVELVRALG